MQTNILVRTLYWLAPLASIAMFIGACPLPALTFRGTAGGVDMLTWSGLDCLGYTLLGPLAFQFEGLANLLLFAAIVALALRHPKAALILSLIALAPALETFTLFKTEVYLDEGGVKKAILTRLEPGFYLWMGSLLMIILASAICRSEKKST
jgi:hypothetical protein